MKKTDIRLQFTKRVLRESLVTLMKTMSIMNITVKDICEAAGVSRTTFYAYYKDQYDILEQLEEEILVEFENLVTQYSPQGDVPPMRELIISMETRLRYIAANNNSVQVLLSENGESGFQRRFAKYLTGRMRKLKDARGGALADERTLNYYSVFIRDGFLAILQEWLKNDMDINIHDMAKMLAKLLRGVLG